MLVNVGYDVIRTRVSRRDGYCEIVLQLRCWDFLCRTHAALLAHLPNPPLQTFIGQHLEMGDGFSVEIYGTLAPETKEAFSGAAKEIGFEVKYFETKLGYTRLGK